MSILDNLFGKNAKKCFLCQGAVKKGGSEVKYKYNGGVGTAHLCKKCSDNLEKKDDSYLGDYDDFSI